jgi:hypothetical protein
MVEQLPLTRDDLIKLYGLRKEVISKNFANLDSAVCAEIRDPRSFAKAPFSSLEEVEKKKYIYLGKQLIKWIKPKNPEAWLFASGLAGFSLREPCDKRIKFIEDRINLLIDIFSEEIKFITDFTSSFCWIQSNDDYHVGSAAFYEIPHCTFFSDLAMFSIPPEIVVPREYSEYAILENLYHEALHHQMHAFSVLAVDGYLLDASSIIPEISLSWRNRKFSLLEAVHALHIYSIVTPLRLQFLKKITNNRVIDLKENKNFEWIFKACNDGLRMWGDLSKVLLTYTSYFQSPWSFFISSWHAKYEDFFPIITKILIELKFHN